MTVQQLIAILSTQLPEAKIVLSGLDVMDSPKDLVGVFLSYEGSHVFLVEDRE